MLVALRYDGFMELAQFIDHERAKIVAEWEVFARSVQPTAGAMSPTALRDHADQILTAIVDDMKSQQSAAEQAEKSKGRGSAQRLGYIGELHASLRIEYGFKLPQMIAEYRALRASVLRLWETNGGDPAGVTRFNESIDEALTEAVDSFTQTTEHYRDQSLAILGHDLRTPLSAIVTGASLLLSKQDLDKGTVRVATLMLSSANRMSRMIEDLLDLTRTRLGDRIPVNPVHLDLEPLCQQVIAELQTHRPPGGVVFTAEGDLHGEWDGDRISQVLSNLVWNAIQHGGKSDPVTVTAQDDGASVVVTVHNSGTPIPENALKAIFQPLVRHTTDSRVSSGLGLGLYISSQIVLAHAGKFEVTSTDAGGTTFTVRLPRTPPSPVLDGERITAI